MLTFLLVFTTVWALVALLVTGLCVAAARGERSVAEPATSTSTAGSR